MARFLVAAVFTTLACASLALPHSHSDISKPESQNDVPLAMIQPEADSGDVKFFFWPFNFWNGFKPLPWIPLPGLQLPTTAAPANGGDDDQGEDEDDKGDDDAADEDEGDDNEDEDEAANEDEEAAGEDDEAADDE